MKAEEIINHFKVDQKMFIVTERDVIVWDTVRQETKHSEFKFRNQFYKTSMSSRTAYGRDCFVVGPWLYYIRNNNKLVRIGHPVLPYKE